MVINYSMKTEKTTVLGVGERAVIWVAGCGRGCPGCIADDMESRVETLHATPEELADWFIHKTGGVKGLTISGGEPFLQSEALTAMIGCIRKMQPETDVTIYSGFYHRELLEDDACCALLALCDVLIDGPYDESRNDGLGMAVGSKNQHVIRLSDRIDEKSLTQYYGSAVRKTEIVLREGRLQLIGVPDAVQMKTWRAIRKNIGS